MNWDELEQEFEQKLDRHWWVRLALNAVVIAYGWVVISIIWSLK
jgi:hypothetical protein